MGLARRLPLEAVLRMALLGGSERTWEIIRGHTGHPDLEEGSVAFVEKRKPRWEPYTD